MEAACFVNPPPDVKVGSVQLGLCGLILETCVLQSHDLTSVLAKGDVDVLGASPELTKSQCYERSE
eukprot:5435188-Amphidinium_carterae.1